MAGSGAVCWLLVVGCCGPKSNTSTREPYRLRITQESPQTRATQIRDDQQVLQFISGLKTLPEALGIFETTPLSRGQSRASAIGCVRRHHRHRSARPYTNRSNRRLQPLMSRVLTDSQPSNTTTRVVQNTDKLTVVARSYLRGTKYFFSLDGSPTN
ncbi:hypothetical protein BGZ61DRAFT_520768 [Ilyonectria robusta]|uniref:uncharacterized protein n=1 Tax=Ilyonectria robusta TaxID=1079257 RepID=UPI001E8E4822|nr:uncharacterized protein BGZ61DRAFT_520768 [Ilyonectria robusta]KAH8674868.1 hypothetical protein BGZ61DRAFT_520768 [Ilyonectria robusta]